MVMMVLLLVSRSFALALADIYFRFELFFVGLFMSIRQMFLWLQLNGISTATTLFVECMYHVCTDTDSGSGNRSRGSRRSEMKRNQNGKVLFIEVFFFVFFRSVGVFDDDFVFGCR